MSEVVPGIAVVTVVLTHRAPLALAEVRSPLFPGHPVLTCMVEPLLLRCFRVFNRYFLYRVH